MAMYNANLAGGGSSVTIDGVVYEGDLKLKSGKATKYYKLPYSFRNGSAVVLNDEVYMIGGEINGYLLFYKFDGTTWQQLGDESSGVSKFELKDAIEK